MISVVIFTSNVFLPSLTRTSLSHTHCLCQAFTAPTHTPSQTERSTPTHHNRDLAGHRNCADRRRSRSRRSRSRDRHFARSRSRSSKSARLRSRSRSRSRDRDRQDCDRDLADRDRADRDRSDRDRANRDRDLTEKICCPSGFYLSF